MFTYKFPVQYKDYISRLCKCALFGIWAAVNAVTFSRLFPSVIGVVVGEMVDRSDLAAATVHPPCPPAPALSQDVLTVFQFHSYVLQHGVQDMETHLLHLAREGEQLHFRLSIPLSFVLLILFTGYFRTDFFIHAVQPWYPSATESKVHVGFHSDFTDFHTVSQIATTNQWNKPCVWRNWKAANTWLTTLQPSTHEGNLRTCVLKYKHGHPYHCLVKTLQLQCWWLFCTKKYGLRKCCKPFCNKALSKPR